MQQMRELVIDSIRISQMNYQRVVVLKELATNLFLLIWIGPTEAEAIAVKMQGMTVPRPLTHDLLVDLVKSVGGTVEHILVSDLENETFYARIVFKIGDQLHEIDSRPSDAIALAVRADAPIFASDSVVEKAGVEMDEETGKPVASTDAGQEDRPMDEGELKRLSAFTEFVSTLDLDDLGQGEKPNPSPGTAETP
jgi:bifunctional DNase/RNase